MNKCHAFAFECENCAPDIDFSLSNKLKATQDAETRSWTLTDYLNAVTLRSFEKALAPGEFDGLHEQVGSGQEQGAGQDVAQQLAIVHGLEEVGVPIEHLVGGLKVVKQLFPGRHVVPRVGLQHDY